MSTVYFPVSKIHLYDNYMKENSNKDLCSECEKH